MSERVVHVGACMLDSEAALLINVLKNTGNRGLTALATAIETTRASSDLFVMLENFETPKVKALRDTCDVDGCNEPVDRNSCVELCTVHQDRFEDGEENWDRPI